MKAELEAFGQRVIVRRIESDRTEGGIYLVDSAKSRSTIGEIISRGPDCHWTQVGDKVFHSTHSGFELPVEGYENCKCMNEEDLLGSAKIPEA